MPKLTPKQERILRFIQSHIERTHTPPSLREIGAQFRIAPGTVQDQIIALEKKGVLERDESRARSLRLPSTSLKIPILGRVFAGDLHTAFENVEGHLFYGQAEQRQNLFALRVRGDSMNGAGIFDGDLAIIRKQQLAANGDIVVALIDDETTIKIFRQHGRTVFLEAANPNYKPIHSAQIKIIGKLVEVRRRYE